MADALVSPAVGGAAWTATAAVAVYCAKKVREENDPAKVPLMGVLGAFIFAAQMLNFTIPGTGSSGHLGGGLILAILLGPHAAFLAIASVLTVQAFFFADGGLLALGCNIFNLGVFPAFVGYPIFKLVVRERWTTGRVAAGGLLGAEAGLLLGAAGVVAETALSGVSALPFGTFVLLMLPIHAAIGVVEGAVTAGVVLFVRQAQPEMLGRTAQGRPLTGLTIKTVLAGLGIAALLAGVALAWFASADPDGLEWSIARVTGSEVYAGDTSSALKRASASIQEATALFPGYGSKKTAPEAEKDSPASWPAVDAGTSTAGVVGAGITLVLAVLLGLALSRRRRSRTPPEDREASV